MAMAILMIFHPAAGPALRAAGAVLVASELAPMVPAVLAAAAVVAAAALEIVVWPVAGALAALRAAATLVGAAVEQMPPAHPREAAPAGARAE